jgi:peroxiredoxin
MHSFRSIFAGLALTVAFTSGCGLPHEKAYESINASKVGTLTGDVGLRPGVAAPNAQLLDTKGSPVTLSDVRANRPTALVFYRGGWCPSCNYQLHELATSSAEFRRRGVALVAVSVDKPDHAVETAKEYGLDFDVLSDPELEAHRAYRVIDHLGGVTTFMIARMGADLEERSGKKHHDVAVPAIFLIDASGTIRWSHADPDYSKRPSAAQILEAIDRSGVAKTAPATAAVPAEPVAAEPTVLR